MKKAAIYVHGKGGSCSEAQQYRKNCEGYDVIGVDYDDDTPWIIVKDKIKKDYDDLKTAYDEILLIANSIGAFFSMLALQNCRIKKALLISPVLDMERLIGDMMAWANVTEQELRDKREIQTDFGETLSWEYLDYVRNNPIKWDAPTEILYAGNDDLTSRQTVDSFIESHNAGLTVMKNGEHWFHTEEQMEFLNNWMKKVI